MFNESLKTRIKNAKSKTEIQDLLQQGDCFKWASAKTRREWDRLSERRKSQLKAA